MQHHQQPVIDKTEHSNQPIRDIPIMQNSRNLIYCANNKVSSAVIKCKVGNYVFNALLDSGACCSLIDSQLLKEIGSFVSIPLSAEDDLYDASGI